MMEAVPACGHTIWPWRCPAVPRLRLRSGTEGIGSAGCWIAVGCWVAGVSTGHRLQGPHVLEGQGLAPLLQAGPWGAETRGGTEEHGAVLGSVSCLMSFCVTALYPNAGMCVNSASPPWLKWKIIKIYLHDFNIRLLESCSQYNREEKNLQRMICIANAFHSCFGQMPSVNMFKVMYNKNILSQVAMF